MPARGKFIVLEGIDGSGKRTQLEALSRTFSQKGIEFSQISFPNYEGFFGKLVARFLNGDFGALSAVDPHFSALLYAGDRLESKPFMEGVIATGKTLLADRYIASNLAHQGARVPLDRRAEFVSWLKELEYDLYALPQEDLVIYLRLPVQEAHDRIGRKAPREYTGARWDLQEADVRHLQAAADVYDDLARQKNWLTIECFDARSALWRPPREIHREILAALATHIPAALSAKG